MLDRFVIGDPEYVLLFSRQGCQVAKIGTNAVLPEQPLRGRRRHTVDETPLLLFRSPQGVTLDCYLACHVSQDPRS
jgi:hypothetical protein